MLYSISVKFIDKCRCQPLLEIGHQVLVRIDNRASLLRIKVLLETPSIL